MSERAAEANYLMRRAGAQLLLAQAARLPAVLAIHLELSSLYLDRARALVAETEPAWRDNVVAIRC